MTPDSPPPAAREALLACPLCHGPAAVLSDNDTTVCCPACELFVFKPTLAEAIATWNRRAALSAAPAGDADVETLLDIAEEMAKAFETFIGLGNEEMQPSDKFLDRADVILARFKAWKEALLPKPPVTS